MPQTKNATNQGIKESMKDWGRAIRLAFAAFFHPLIRGIFIRGISFVAVVACQVLTGT